MVTLEQKKKWRRVFYSYWTLVALFTGLFFLGQSVFRVYFKYQEAALNEGRAAKELADLKAREQSLAEHADRLKTQSGIEQEIRDKYQVTKNGEHLIIIVDDPQKNSQNQATVVASGGWWQNFLHFLGF